MLDGQTVHEKVTDKKEREGDIKVKMELKRNRVRDGETGKLKE